ncbi:DELTA-sagatoxin-Srs1a-like [Astyanax mexicanus]|uniref:DELTA-sagatoxin-Srs1a-like n=1 Tax=Astyanax mexicanus TaxID=7994 RepID=A0A8T2L9N7_ASTMX|nr:DELTA-sagatoxin-Srs1a-like [Astyanax mexicanus]
MYSKEVSRGVIPGMSLAGTSTEQISKNISTCRNVTIQITNHSDRYILTNPRIYNCSGYCCRPPQPTINKNTCEVCCFSKTSLAACGSVGVLMYQISLDNTSYFGDLAVMFSVPFDYNLYKNMFALSNFYKAMSCDYDLFCRMYYLTGLFTRGKGTGSAISHFGEHVRLTGTMSAFGKSIINVEVWDKGTNNPVH